MYVLGHTLHVPGMYWCVRKQGNHLNVHDVRNRPNNLMHANHPAIPLCYQREVLGEVNGLYRENICSRYLHAGDKTPCACPAAPPLDDIARPDINSDFPSLGAQVGCKTLLGSCWVPVGGSLTEKRSLALRLARALAAATRRGP